MQINKRDVRYFSDENGKTFIPVGCNLCFVRDSENMEEKEVLALYHDWMTRFAAQGGNYVRIWLGVPFFDVMPEKIGQFDERAVSHIRYIITLAEKLGIKLKFTLEHFRRTVPNKRDAESFPGVVSFVKTLYGPYAQTMGEYLASDICRQAYLEKASYLAKQGFGDSPAVAAWELWNEINCIGDVYGNVGQWSRFMIGELQKIFPKQMILQNLGSYSSVSAFHLYDSLSMFPGNAFMQIHCYLDPGAALDFCRGPMDVIASRAVHELHSRAPQLPAVVAECGAVEANHSRYSDLYEADTQGVLLHDILFAPFFSGSAGCGQPWHWDHIYIAKHDLWHHFGRFVRAIRGIDPAEEQFRVFYTETHRLRLYGLKGRYNTLLWCRDKASSWETELKQGIAPGVVTGEKFPCTFQGKVSCCLVWEDREIEVTVENNMICLPDFTRSMVMRYPTP